jgi:hypothetical protein
MTDTRTLENPPSAKLLVEKASRGIPLAYSAAAALAGTLIYVGGVSLWDLFSHPIWSAGRIAQGILDELAPLLGSFVSGSLLVAPVWAFQNWRSRQ